MPTADDETPTRLRTTPTDEPTSPATAAAPPSETGGKTPSPARARRVRTLVVVGMVVAALNLRPAISGLGPLLEEVRVGLGMNPTVAGLVTSLPPACFAAFGGLAPRLARRWGPASVLLLGMASVLLGLLLRAVAPDTVSFLAASVLALVGIAVSNVLMPVVVKHWFPDKVGSMTGLYSMALAVGTSGSAAIAVPMTEALGGSWRLGIGAWAVLGVVGVAVWGAIRITSGSGREPKADERPGTEPEARVRVVRSPTAWALALFFGLQASAAYITMGWMAQIYRDSGVAAPTAGLLVAVTMGMGIPLAFVLPRAAARMRHQGPLVLLLGVCGLAGYAGLYFAPVGGAWLWALVLGVSNCAFPLALTMIGMRARSHAGVVRLSAFAQSTGYLLSIPGPLLVGALNGATGGWRIPLIVMAALLVAQMATGVLAGRNRVIEDGR
ncbi:CynX/NimT family MFS transporter [Streptomyces xiaopingdaonensis]|uniref:CynX/NimT family MFS transporter n=1 Tax=Streptomyces xiaopingdaonensis TaxID=1565415 RepID=UPI0002DDDE4F|nr:MFS transporter [Streptomyces xiaopingdaonensis]